MKRLIAALLVLSAPYCATAQSPKGRDYRSVVEIRIDPETGMRTATSIKAAEIKEKRSYSPGAEAILVFWVEARKPETGPAQVILKGEKLRYILPKEAPEQREFGPWDPPEPVSVGSPWQDADIRYRGMKVECVGSQYWCTQIWLIEVAIPDAVVRSLLAKPSMKELRLSLSNRRRVEWRTPREEVIATIDKLGVLAEFSGPPIAN